MTLYPIIDKAGTLGALPQEWSEDLLPGIRAKLGAGNRKIVILDDDPTGTQTVHGLPVLTTWSRSALEDELVRPDPGVFILTNSRCLTDPNAHALAVEIGQNLKAAAASTGMEPVVISRSDSTLRGHFPAEVDAFAHAMGQQGLPYLIVPFFLEGGRLTLDDVHYVAEGKDLIPAGQTPYAKDAAFGFESSNLKDWVAEKTKGRIPAAEVVSVSLDDIRKGGPDRVARVLSQVPENGACIVNAASYRDMEVVVAALGQVAGSGFLFRTAASFVRVYTGTQPRTAFLTAKELSSDTGRGGLFVVGSYVPKTSAQLDILLKTTDITAAELNVTLLLDPERADQEVKRVQDLVNERLAAGKDTLIYTSRDLVTGPDAAASLDIGQKVSQSLIRIVQALENAPRYLVAKGGITSSDVATQGLGVKRAMIQGQVLPGVPVWKLGRDARFPGMSYIIFPGNVGADDDLARVHALLAREVSC